MKKLKYVGQYEADLPTLGIAVTPGDVIEVEDNFENVLFVLVEEVKVLTEAKLKGDK